MAINFDRKDLEKKLDEIITVLTKKGLMPTLNADAKKDLIKNVADKLIQDPKITLTKFDLQNEATLNALGVSCVAQLQQTINPNFKFDYRCLFNEQEKIDKDDFKNQINNLLLQMIQLNPTYQNKSTSEKAQIDAEVNELAGILANKLPKKDSATLAENKYAFNLITTCVDALREQRREMYGIDTEQPGEIVGPVLGVPYGNQAGLQDLATQGWSWFAKTDEPNPGVEDPTGAKMNAILNYITDGVTTDFEKQLQQDGIIPSPSQTPTLKPQGIK